MLLTAAMLMQLFKAIWNTAANSSDLSELPQTAAMTAETAANSNLMTAARRGMLLTAI